MKPSDREWKSAYGEFMDWQKYVLSNKPKLSPGIHRVTLVGFALILATYGRNGRGIFVSDARLAEVLSSHRDTMRKYRREAIRVGWFKRTGETTNRVAIIEISFGVDAWAAGEDD